jgi:hypothetical protein
LRADVGGGLDVTKSGGVGFIILSHHNLDRTAALALALAKQGKVIVHVDAKCPDDEFDALVARVKSQLEISFSRRILCTWGMFSLTEAVLVAAESLLAQWPDLDHICHVSGDSLPVRPLAEFAAYLAGKRGVDLIESVSALDDNWIKGGLGIERFQYWFPLSWRGRRKAFDRLVEMQRKLGVSRKPPLGIEPHLGSQWWCLTGQTMRAILDDPQRKKFDRYFRWCWIPDESYFQTLARRHSKQIESKSFMLNHFDESGQPHIFYDDHADALAASGAFFARKIWHGAEKLYGRFLGAGTTFSARNVVAIDQLVAEAAAQRKHGRKGLIMQSRLPAEWADVPERTAREYDVICGYDHLVVGLRSWLASKGSVEVHGRLFGPGRVVFHSGLDVEKGGLPALPSVRDFEPVQFLRNLIWNKHDQSHCFLLDPKDNSAINEFVAKDKNARVHFLTGAWVVELFLSGRTAQQVKTAALQAQAAERRFLNQLQAKSGRARLEIRPISDFLGDPARFLRTDLMAIQNPISTSTFAMPEIRLVDDLARFVESLENLGVPVPSLAAKKTDITQIPVELIRGAKL